MEFPLYQVDAFALPVFHGSPAVGPLPEWLPDETLQLIATENNPAETAYFVPAGTSFQLRWFTPLTEVDLCGHATLASAYVLFEYLHQPGPAIVFETRAGELTVTREGDLFTLDFPSSPPAPINHDVALLSAMGGRPREVLGSGSDLALLVYETESDVLALTPDMRALTELEPFGFIATAAASGVDFVLRFFANAKGIPEDFVTGSAHTILIPDWAGKLGKKDLTARQGSRRRGDLYCKLVGDRVHIAGHVSPYLRGTITIH